MSVDVTNACRRLQMTAAQKCVLMAIADRADDNGVGWPSIPWISEWTCFGRTAVIEALKWLEASGFIQVTKVTGRNNLFAVDLDLVRRLAPPNPSATRTTTRPGDGLVEGSDAHLTGDQTAPNQSATRTGPAGEPVRETDYHPSATRTTTRPGDGLTRPAGGPDTSLNTNKTLDRHSARTKKSTEEPEGFDEFWSAYPLKTSKVAAVKAFRALKPSAELLTAMLAGLAMWKRHEKWTKDAGKYRHHASTWLNQQMWTDEEVCGKRTAARDDHASIWWQEAGFEHVAEAQNARCHVGNYREFRDGKRIDSGAHA